MNLDKTTYGKTPAAIYLADCLNKINDKTLIKKVGKTINHYRTFLLELETANNNGFLSAHTLASIVSNTRKNFQLDLGDPFISNLVTNIVVGDMKSLLRKSSTVRKIENCQKKFVKKETSKSITTDGYLAVDKSNNIKTFPKYSTLDIKDKITPESLLEDWKVKHKGKFI